MTEQQPYRVLQQFPEFELREYPAAAIAEVTVDGDFEQAGNRAFGSLFGYISGRNGASTKIAMTAPVLQRPSSAGQHAVAFVLPSTMEVQDAPAPADPSIDVRELPPTRTAALTYSGRWSEESYRRHCNQLVAAIAREGLKPVGEARFARYNAPFTPWFLRRNEVLVNVA